MRPKLFHDISRDLAIRIEAAIRGDAASSAASLGEDVRGESGEEAGGESSMPVYICHPLDALEGAADQRAASAEPGAGVRGATSWPGSAVGVLYLMRISPESRCRQVGVVPDERRPIAGRTAPERWRQRGFWSRLRFAFLVVGGTQEDELGALEAVLQALQDDPVVQVEQLPSVRAALDEQRASSASAGEDWRPDEDAEADAAPDAVGARTASESFGDSAALSSAASKLPIELVDHPDAWRELGLPEHRLSISFEVVVPIVSRRTFSVPRIAERALELHRATPAEAEGPQR